MSRHPQLSFWIRCLAASLATLICWAPALGGRAQDPEELPAEYAPAEEGPLREGLADAFDDEVPGDVEAAEGLDGLDPDSAREVAAALAAATEGASDVTATALPSGQAQSAVTPQAISLPNAEGSIEGMGESFAPVLSSGTGTYSVPIALPPGRAGVQPSLALSYASSGGNGPVGVGWGLGAPMIHRQTDRGLPRYDDRAAWHPQEDRFIYNGGQELVPVDSAEMQRVDCAGQPTEHCAPVPGELTGWQQYRARVEGGFLRFFRSPDSSRWVVQGKDGTRFDFGFLPAGDGPAGMVSASADSVVSEEDDGVGRVFKWCLTRMSDAHGSTVYYRYFADGGQRYLEDIFYVSPASCASGTPGTASSAEQQRECAAPMGDYGRRVHLVYEGRSDSFTSYITGWGVETALRVKRVEVTAAEGAPGRRTLVRRYHLGYEPTSFNSLLSQVQVEGRPSAMRADVGVMVGDPDVDEGSFGDELRGELLPPMRFQYSTQPTTGDLIPGFGGVDGTAHDVVGSPPHSVDEGRSDLFDINSDGLPDLIVTDPARFRTDDDEPAVGVYFNGFSGRGAEPAHRVDSEGRWRGGVFSSAVPVAVPDGFAGVMTLSNINVRPMDIDGDGRSELLYMPRIRGYGYFVPTRAPDVGVAEVSPANQGWRFSRVLPQLPPDFTDPRIDFTRDNARIKVFDVNNDHLVDVVRTAGNRVQTWLNLGWLPEGDGRFGSASYREGAGWELSADPLETCALDAGLPVDFADPELRLADMNGDGVQDIVKLRRGRLIYWPGKGDAQWGVEAQDCLAPGVAPANYVDMGSAPPVLNPELSGVFLADVNADGATDVIQVRFDDVDVWFNQAGQRFAERVVVSGTPAAPDFSPRIRLADIDGSGTLDLVYGNAGRWQFIDFMGGTRPRLLTGVANGLGATTELTYDSAAADYLADLEEAAACAEAEPFCERFTWSDIDPTGCDPRLTLTEFGPPETARCYRPNGSAVTSTIIRAVSVSDNFDLLGREPQISETRFAYHDGYYEGIEQEFRGFGAADAESVGDANHPTSLTRTHFLQGRRPSAIASDRLADNPNEALKGRQVTSEVFDEGGVVLSTDHASFTVRRLAVGLSGVAVSYAYVNQSDSFRYDNAPFTRLDVSIELPAVVREDLTSGEAPLPPDEMGTAFIRGERYAHIRSVTPSVDNVGDVLEQTALGRLRGEFGARDEPLPDESITSHTTPENLATSSSGWLWRTQRSFTDGHGSTVPLGDTSSSFNDVGDLLRSEVAVSHVQADGTERLFDFAGDGDAEGLPSRHEDVVTSAVYDAWGNATASCGGDLEDPSVPCLRFGQVTYDADYAQFPEFEEVDVSPEGAGGRFLGNTATWDRGFGVIISTADPNGFATRLTYDGLARPTSAILPDEAGCDGRSRPVTRNRYLLSGQRVESEAFEPDTTPLSRVTSTTELSCAASSLGSDATTLQGVVYVDGLGRPRVSLATGDETMEHRWLRSGVVAIDKKGTSRRAYQPAFYAGAADDFDAVVALPSVPFVSERYDAFGRVRASVKEDGTATWTSYHALSTDACDANDLDPASPHYRTCITSRSDGHGRAVDLVQRNHQADRPGVETYRLLTDYRADNAVVRVRRAQTTNDAPRQASVLLGGRTIERRFFYDNVARRIASTDPDTDDRTNPARASNTWRYLFNRVGDLAGVRDPRGCGQNFYYDHAGRLLGEVYVACGEAEPHELAPPGAVVPSGAVGFAETSTSIAVDSRSYFDAYPEWTTPLGGFPSAAGFVEFPNVDARAVLGRATGTTDRAQRCVYAYDERGQVLWEGRQVALLPEVPDDLALLADTLDGPVPSPPATLALRQVVYDAAHTYERSVAYDHAGRPTATVLPRDPDFDRTDASAGPRVGGTLFYNRRGAPSRIDVRIWDGGTGTDPSEAPFHISDALEGGGLSLPGATVTAYPVVQHIDYLRDGLVGRVVYGDGDDFTDPGVAPPLPGPDTRPSRAPTVTTADFDVRRRSFRGRTTREPTLSPGSTGMRPLAEVSTVVDQRLQWDVTNNLIALIDDRNANEWPAGHRPQSVHIAHDALYRVVDAEYDYTDDDGARRPDDDATDWRDELARTQPNDPMVTEPAPLVPASPPGRVASLTYEYDWLSNMVDWSDDAGAFYERSLGALRNGADSAGLGVDPALRPSALYLSTQLDAASVVSGQGGWLEIDYGASGNMHALTLHGQCAQATGTMEACADPLADTDLDATRAGLRAGCACAIEQHYRYDWDELNRVARARRYDRPGTGGWELRARVRYRYDANNQRIVKEVQSIAMGGPGAGPPDRVALYVFPGDFERRGLQRSAGRDSDRYVAAAGQLAEAQYLVGGARVVWKAEDPATRLDRDHRITFGIGDLIGTTSAVIDLVTGELTEYSTYYPNGARETYLATPDAELQPEPAGFTGKEADEEVGLVYFGMRYLVPRVGRWASPDPLAVHAGGGGEFGNSYHYVAGNLLQGRDPVGLQDPQGTAGSEAALSAAIEVSTLPTDEAGQPLIQAGDGDYFVAGPGPQEDRGSGAGRTDFVSYANENGLSIFVYRPDSDAPTFEAAVAARPDTAVGMATNLIGMLGGDMPVANGVDGGLPGGTGDPENAIGANVALAVTVIVALGGRTAKAARKLYRVARRALRRLPARARRALHRALNRAWRTPGCPGCPCFVAGTLVAMADGAPKPIEQVAEGDWVVADNPEDSVPAQPYRVVSVHQNYTYRVVRIVVRDRSGTSGEIESTGEHPFWTQADGWVAADALVEGDVLLEYDGRRVNVVAITVESREVDTFNLTVEGMHTFFVVTNGISVLVHNQPTIDDDGFFAARHEYGRGSGSGRVRIPYQGSRGRDFTLANAEAGFAETPEGYTWHHANYNSRTGYGDMQLVRTDTHRSRGHAGGVSGFQRSTGLEYDSRSAVQHVEARGRLRGRPCP